VAELNSNALVNEHGNADVLRNCLEGWPIPRCSAAKSTCCAPRSTRSAFAAGSSTGARSRITSSATPNASWAS
jgi:hypothetical protein